MEPTEDIEDVEILKARFDTFEQEMKTSSEKVATVNTLARGLLHNEHPNADVVIERQNKLNQKYSDLQNMADTKKGKLSTAHDVNTWHIECDETMVSTPFRGFAQQDREHVMVWQPAKMCFSKFQTWIREKAKLIESTDDLGTDLGGVMQLQRRLSGLERDLAAIQAKLDSLNKEADRLQDEKPEEAAAIREKITQITELWQELKTMVWDSR